MTKTAYLFRISIIRNNRRNFIQKYPNNNFLPLDRFLQTIGYNIQHTIQVTCGRWWRPQNFSKFNLGSNRGIFIKKYHQINYMLAVQSVFTTMQFTDRFSSTNEILWKPQNCFAVQPGNFLAKIKPTSINNFINVPPILTNNRPIDLLDKWKLMITSKNFLIRSRRATGYFSCKNIGL